MTRELVIAMVILGVLVSVPALAQDDQGSVNLPPLVIQSPQDYSTTSELTSVTYSLSSDDFIVADDGDETPVIECEINGDRKLVDGSYDRITQTYSTSWILEDGDHAVSCVITDSEGATTKKTHNVSITLIEALFRDSTVESKIKRLSYLLYSGAINTDQWDLIIKYFHIANLISFDIENDRHVNPDRSYDNYNSSYSSSRNLKNYVYSWYNDSVSNILFKAFLEDRAERGNYDRVDLGF